MNFSDTKLLKLTPAGDVTQFGTLPHIRNLIASDRGYLYVASVSGRQVHRVSLTTGEVTHIAGSGDDDPKDGPAFEAAFAAPNGIAAVGGGRLLINDINNPPPMDAIAAFERSLEINPENTNAVEKLEELRGRD